MASRGSKAVRDLGGRSTGGGQLKARAGSELAVVDILPISRAFARHKAGRQFEYE